MTHKVISDAVAAGLLEPCVIFDGDARELRGYRPTRYGQRWFGEQFAQRDDEACEPQGSARARDAMGGV